MLFWLMPCHAPAEKSGRGKAQTKKTRLFSYRDFAWPLRLCASAVKNEIKGEPPRHPSCQPDIAQPGRLFYTTPHFITFGL
ncbi:hypothetical protein D4L85_18180 [Chryseolinea soli]|uniref:Uncharacterized protein n=1 Tax=Chryseolinea soli TaxID=2321403 RepID=A0A385SMG1_9BACT|nr:hypothetical protein D4L85_18180 [Chryseolinea soli]